MSVLQDLYALRGGLWDSSYRIWLLDVDVEVSIFTWISTVALYSAALLLIYIGLCVEPGGQALRLTWVFLGLVFLLLSMDEHSGVHEKLSGVIGGFVQGSGLFYFAWAAPAGIVCLVGLVALVPFLRSLPADVCRWMLLSAAMFLLGAVGFEMIGGLVAERQGIQTFAYRLATNIEELLEISGVFLFIYMLLMLIGRAKVVDPETARIQRGVQAAKSADGPSNG